MSDATAAAAPPEAVARVLAEIADIPHDTEGSVLRKRSRDFFWYSPVLNEELAGLAADLVVSPRDEAEVIRVAAACARHRVPLTPRGAGTGNYGQAVPLQGGVLLDMSGLDRVEWAKPGTVRTGPGLKMGDLDAALRGDGGPSGGQELRIHPSTKRTATIGGFIAGGSGGVGSVTWGGLREPGNIGAARIVTLEAEPRVLELRADAAQKINRAYGTTGIITALEMPLATAWAWIDVVVAFESFDAAFQAGRDVALADGVMKKLIAPVAWPIPSYFGALRPACPDGAAVLLCMIAEPSFEAFRSVLAGRGEITRAEPTNEGAGSVPLYEYAWNHTTLQVLKSDRSVTYLQCLYPQDRLAETVALMAETFDGELIPHLEFIRFAGRVTASALPVLRYSTKARLDEIIAFHEANGVLIANPHVVTLEDGSRHKRADADQLGFKAEVDPRGLLNPGKMKSFVPVAG